MASNYLNGNVGGYADRDSNSWIGLPGQYLKYHHLGIYDGGYARLRCDENLNVYISLHCTVYGWLYSTDYYNFKIYSSPSWFQLTAQQDGGDPVPSHGGVTHIASSSMNDGYTFGNYNVYMSRELNTDEVYIGKLTDFGWNEYDQTDNTGSVWICGCGYGYWITSNITVNAIRIPIPGMRTWIDYFPGVIYGNGGFKNSCNRSGGYFKVLQNGVWQEKRNRKGSDAVHHSSVFIGPTTTNDSVAPLLP